MRTGGRTDSFHTNTLFSGQIYSSAMEDPTDLLFHFNKDAEILLDDFLANTSPHSLHDDFFEVCCLAAKACSSVVAQYLAGRSSVQPISLTTLQPTFEKPADTRAFDSGLELTGLEMDYSSSSSPSSPPPPPDLDSGSSSSSSFPELKHTPISPPQPLPRLPRGRHSPRETQEVQAIKRQIRMIRNRESASLSRKKKKEYVTGLESTIKALRLENERLKRENEMYRRKEKEGKSKRLLVATAKVGLFSVCLFCAFLPRGGGREPPGVPTSGGQSRVILKVREFKGNSSSHICADENFNKTESLRVQSSLEGLFMRKRRKPVAPRAPLVYSLISTDLQNTHDNKGLTLYRDRSGEYSSILEKLKRREDTFYVVSLTAQNHLLLPAKASNHSARPKMTFLMPWRNETDGVSREELMQIDCEVLQVLNLNSQSRKKRGRRFRGN